MLKEIGKKALLAAEELKTIDTDTKNKVLNDMASELVNDADEIIEANKIDLENLIKKLFSNYYFNWDFRYLFRDNLLNYLSADKSISNKLNSLTQFRFNMIKKEALIGRDVGIFDFKENELDELSEIIFLVADNWFSLSAYKYPDKDESFLIQRGMGLLIKVSEPYLSKESKKIVKNLYGGIQL